MDDRTDFGYESVTPDEKTARVGAVFDSVASQYDVMNDLMSFGVHRLWKRVAIRLSAVRSGDRVLDLAGGTGDLALKLADRVGASGSDEITGDGVGSGAGQVVLADINAAMLGIGRDRLVDGGMGVAANAVQADASALPFADNSFDCVTIAFGLRNVTEKSRALASILRTLRPGGRLIVLEFSRPALPGLGALYDFYSFGVLPRLGALVANDADSYRYLAESIRMHPDQQTLKQMMTDSGFAQVEYFNLSGGIVAIHRGYKT